MQIYMNDFDPTVCEWLRELQTAGLIPEGTVDERSISEVLPADLVGFRHCHFFTGIAGWPDALRLAGWPTGIHTFSGSPPCQPFSTAGKRKGKADERHLWPEYFRLVRNVRPLFAFGEQVEGAVRLGWLDGVQADLEGAGYTFWPVVLGAHSGGAPHIRLRFFFVAVRNDAAAVLAQRAGLLADPGHRVGGRAGVGESGAGDPAERDEVPTDTERRGGTGGAGNDILADAGRGRVRGVGLELGGAAGGTGGEVREQRVRDDAGDGSHARGVEHPASDGRGERRAEPVGRGTAGGCGGDYAGGLGDTTGDGHRPVPVGGGDCAGTGEGRQFVAGGRCTTGGLGDTGRELGERRVAGGPRGGVGTPEDRPVEPGRYGSHGGVADDQSGGCDERAGDDAGPSGRRRARPADSSGVGDTSGRGEGAAKQQGRLPGVVETGGNDRRVADADGRQSGDGKLQRGGEHGQQQEDGGVGGLADTTMPGTSRLGGECGASATAQDRQRQVRTGIAGSRMVGGDGTTRADGVALGNTVGTGLQVGECDGGVQRPAGRPPAGQTAVVSGHANFWSAYDVIHCRDNKWRRIPKGSAQPLLFGLAHGVQHRLGGGGVAGGGHGEGSFPLSFEKVEGRAAVLKGLGNAICPQIAAEFVSAVMEVLGIQPEYH